MDARLPNHTAEGLIDRKKATWPEASDPYADLVIRLFRIRDIVYENSRKKVKRNFKLTPAEFEVIATLRTLEPPYRLTPTELRKALLITPGGITKVLRNLESRRLISRRQSVNDGRSSVVQLTKQGIGLAESALPSVIEDYKEQISFGLDNTEMADVSDILQRLLGALEPR